MSQPAPSARSSGESPAMSLDDRAVSLCMQSVRHSADHWTQICGNRTLPVVRLDHDDNQTDRPFPFLRDHPAPHELRYDHHHHFHDHYDRPHAELDVRALGAHRRRDAQRSPFGDNRDVVRVAGSQSRSRQAGKHRRQRYGDAHATVSPDSGVCTFSWSRITPIRGWCFRGC